MEMNERELRQKRAGLVDTARKILKVAENEKRALTADEETKYNRLDAEIDTLTAEINVIEQQAERKAKLAEIDTSLPSDPDNINTGSTEEQETRAFEKFLTFGMSSLDAGEQRLMQVATGPGGGYLVPPARFIRQLIKEIDDNVVIRTRATRHQLTANTSLGVPTLDVDIADADWTTELGTGSEGVIKFGRREMKPNPLAKRVKVSNQLLRLTDIEAIVRERLAYKFSISEEKAYMTGDGVNKPLGLFVASTDGIPTSRDVSAGNKTTTIEYEGLVNAQTALKSGYHRAARWLFHRDALGQIRKLKDTTGSPIWQPGMAAGVPDRLLGMPYMFSEFVPNTFSTGAYVGMLADFSAYWIVEAFDIQIQRLVELYAETNQTGFIARRELDGAPVMAEAFVRITLA